MPEKTLAVKLNVQTRSAALDLEEAILSVPGFRINSNGAPSDLMVVEVGNDLDEEFGLIEQARAKGLAAEIFLTSSSNAPEVLLRALKAGVKEFFPQPLNKAEVTASLAKFQRSAEGEGPRRTKADLGILITVLGSKGGVGATTAAVNLAVALQQMAPEKSVALIDMNPLLGGVHIFLDIKNSFSWAEGARDIARVDSTYLFNTLYRHPTGVHVLPAPARPVGLEAATPETMAEFVGRMRSAFDIVVMDGCKSFDDLSLRMLGLSTTILIVSELNILSVVNARKLLETFDGLGLSHGKDIKVVVNRFQKNTMVSPTEAEKTLGRKIVSLIPNDYEATMSAINTGRTLSDMPQKSDVTENFRELAALLLHKEIPRKAKSLFPLHFGGRK